MKKWMLAALVGLSAAVPAIAVDRAGMDLSVRPGNDFWTYANGAWDRATPIPADKHTYGGAWVLDDIMEARVRAIAEDQALAAADPRAAKVSAFYRSYLDYAARDSAGIAPVAPLLARIDAVTDRTGLTTLFADHEFPAPYGLFVAPHPRQPDRYALFVNQASLGLPDRDYYLTDKPKMGDYRAAYRSYLVRLSELGKLPDAEGRADRVMALETAIARELWDRTRTRDVSQTVNPMSLAEFDKLAPGMALPAALAKLKVNPGDSLIAWTPSALAGTSRLLVEQPLDVWKDWMRLRLLDQSAPYLTRQFEEAAFAFRSRTLRGIEQSPPAWQRAVRLLNEEMGDAVAELYLDRHLPPAAQQKAVALVDDLFKAFEERLRANSWMDEATRSQALAKLAALDSQVGRPNKFLDYSALQIADHPLLNVQRAERISEDFHFARVGKPVTADHWSSPAQMVNGYYSFFENRLRIQAGFLQPPFFDPDGDPAANYAGIGMIIGHEIGHGFDDQGRKFDARGAQRDWWSASAARAYDARASELVRQYNAYSPTPGITINGKLTLGENIGDLGGLEMAYAAWRRHVARTGEPPVKDGLSGDQRFFIYYAQAWREKSRPDFLRQMILTDPHSPGIFRANGAVRNVDAWYRAFGVKPGDRLYLPPSKRVRIW
jgi:endothelin-converting enzyme/putative endopeptidase